MHPSADPLTFVLAGDHRVRWGIAATIGSILQAVPRRKNVRLIVIDGGLSPAFVSRLRRVVDANGWVLDVEPFRWPEGCRAPALEGSFLTYARLLTPDLVPGKTCIYIDADTVLREDPEELVRQVELQSEVAAWAVSNYPDNRFIHQLGRQRPALVEGVSADTPYFNAGFLIINLEWWREHRVAKRCFELAAEHQFISHDQDALNVALRGAWRELPARWNHQLFGRHDIPRDAALLHYSGRNKPWHFGYPREARVPFTEAVAAAGWKRWTARPSLRQWLRNSSIRPTLASLNYQLRRCIGLAGVQRR